MGAPPVVATVRRGAPGVVLPLKCITGYPTLTCPSAPRPSQISFQGHRGDTWEGSLQSSPCHFWG